MTIEPGKAIHCMELNTGANLSGNFCIAKDCIYANIYSFADTFLIDEISPIYLQTETNDIVSLHSIFRNEIGRFSRLKEPIRTTYKAEINANIAIVGYNRWSDSDTIRQVRFTVKHTKSLLRHKGLFQSINSNKFPEIESLQIFNDLANEMKLRARYGVLYTAGNSAPDDIWPIFEIEFRNKITIFEYLNYVKYYLYFLSFCIGIELRPDDVYINRLSHDEVNEAIKLNNYPGDHQVHYIWPEKEIDPNDLLIGGSPFISYEDNELVAFRQGLIAWMNRAQSWKKSYILMAASFAQRNTTSSERLITACRWFEDIPIAQSKNALLDRIIDEIALAAAEKGNEFELDSKIVDRITNAVRWIKEETRDVHFLRLIKIIHEKFGKDLLPEDILSHLIRAMQFRGKIAHGHFEPENEAESIAFDKATRALEAFCYLLTALDLPISAEGIGRLSFNSVIRDCKRA